MTEKPKGRAKKLSLVTVSCFHASVLLLHKILNADAISNNKANLLKWLLQKCLSVCLGPN